MGSCLDVNQTERREGQTDRKMSTVITPPAHALRVNYDLAYL